MWRGGRAIKQKTARSRGYSIEPRKPVNSDERELNVHVHQRGVETRKVRLQQVPVGIERLGGGGGSEQGKPEGLVGGSWAAAIPSQT